MSYIYSDPTRESDAYALPDVEVFHLDVVTYPLNNAEDDEDNRQAGWYWWACFPGCMPTGDPLGPFETEAEAIADAQDIEVEA